MKVCDLPVYSECLDSTKKYSLEQIKPNKVEETVLKLVQPTRKFIVDWATYAERKCEKSFSKVYSTSTSIFQCIRDDPVIVARSGFITVCGLGGFVLGYRGGILRKITYATLATTIGTSVSFPSATYQSSQQALSYTKKQIKEFKNNFITKK